MGSLSIDIMIELALLYRGMPYRHSAQIFKLALNVLEGDMANDNCGQSYQFQFQDLGLGHYHQR